MKYRISAAALCFALSALPALAQDKGAQDEGAPLTQLFISPCGEPFRAVAAAPYPAAAWFAKADANHDGAIDRAEFRADADRFFDTLDVNHDGVLSSFEVSRYEHVVAPEILGAVSRLDMPAHIFLAQMDMGGVGGVGGMGGPSGMGGMGGGLGPGGHNGPPDSSGGEEVFPHKNERIAPSTEGAAPFNLLGEPEPVASSDGNFDGRITKAEFESAADRRFHRLDGANAGKLTLAALPTTRYQRFLAGRRGPPDRS